MVCELAEGKHTAFVASRSRSFVSGLEFEITEELYRGHAGL